MRANKLKKLLIGRLPRLPSGNKGFPFNLAPEPSRDRKGPRTVFDIGLSEEDAGGGSFDVEIERYKIVKLIEFALKKKTFTVEEALEVSTLDYSEFERTIKILFEQPPGTENQAELSQRYEWTLKPEAFLRYMTFAEYRESLRSARKDLRPAFLFIALLGGLALACFLAATL